MRRSSSMTSRPAGAATAGRGPPPPAGGGPALTRAGGGGGDAAKFFDDVATGGRGNGGTGSRRAGDEVRDFTQRAGAGELVHDALHALLLRGGAELLQGGQDFDALDGVDAQVGFNAGVQVEHLRRIAGALGGDAAQVFDEAALGWRRWRRSHY